MTPRNHEKQTQFEQFIQMIAKFNMDCEWLEDGSQFQMAPDDAIDTLNALIERARGLVG
jgi:hypothetical protein